MASNTNQFLISVADVIIRDREADQVMIYGKTEIDSSIAQEVQNQEITGGFGSKLLYEYSYGKRLNVTINDARFDENYIALNSGVLIENIAQNVYKREVLTLNGSGVGTCTSTPVGKVYLKYGSQIVTTTPTASTFTYAPFANNTVEAIYKYSTTVDSIDINAEKFPKTYELTLIGKIFDKTGQSAELQIIIPQWKPMGSFTLNFTAEGNTTSPIEGKAFADEVTQSYGRLNIIPTSTTVSYVAIAALPASPTISTTNTTQQISVYGIRGGSYANVCLDTSSCTYVSGTTATCTVNSTGLITRVASGTSLITITHTASGLKDYINVTSS